MNTINYLWKQEIKLKEKNRNSSKVRNCHTFLTEIKDLVAFSFVKGFPMNLLDFVTYKTPKIIDNNHI